jgi:tetrapyrrole methylase family protein/MazG family protein
MQKPPKDLEKFASLLEIVKSLRGPEGCPWDKEQTHRSLTPFAIEEAHELAEAIELGDHDEMIKELGDLLLQVVLHSEIGRQEGRFSIDDVVRGISEKMVHRHPHVFAGEKVTDSADVLSKWADIKAAEKKAQNAQKPQTERPSRFDIPLTIPALMRSQKIGDKTKSQKFDWNNSIEVFAKVEEEVAELRQELERKTVDPKAVEHEIGDLLFSLAQLARHAGLEAEQALRTANARFEKRYFTMRNMVEDSGHDWNKLTPEEREAAWVEVKKQLAQKPN